jgi:hypothetical protein
MVSVLLSRELQTHRVDGSGGRHEDHWLNSLQFRGDEHHSGTLQGHVIRAEEVDGEVLLDCSTIAEVVGC